MASTSSIALLTACLGPFLSSQLYSPSNPGSGFISYNWLKTSANDRIPKYPTAILLLPNISFVSQAVTCARTSGIQPVVRSGGHSSEGSSSLSDKLIIDLSYCNNLVSIFESPVGSGNFQAKFEAGMKLGQVYSTLFNAGQWTVAGGVCPYVGAGGHLTGGGEGMLTRKYGLGADQLTAVDVVLADGRAVTTNSSSYSDLFWALRGGGGASFGVVTHFTANLFKVPTSSMFFLKFSCAAEVLNLWQTFFVTAPNELNAQYKMSKNDTWINGQYLGPMTGPNGLQTLMTNAGILTMQSLIWYDFKTCSGLNARAYVIGGLDCSVKDLELLATDPIEPNPREGSKSKTDNFNSLMPASVLNAVTNMLLSDANGDIYGHSLGGDGVFASLSATATPFSDRSAWHTLEYHYSTTSRNSYYPGSTSYIWLNTLSELVKPYTSGRKYLNYQDFDLPSYFGIYYWGWDNFQRLVAVKNKYDPTNFFNNPQSVPLSINFTSFAPTMVSSSAPSFTWNPTVTAVPSTSPTICLNSAWGQCGGGNYVGPVCCPAGSCCKYSNAYWSACEPSAVACPTPSPTVMPTGVPTSAAPVYPPTIAPTNFPTMIISSVPSSNAPSERPSFISTSNIPTALPSSTVPSGVPSFTPSEVPSIVPSVNPSIERPTNSPTSVPSSVAPTSTPSACPSTTPSACPSTTPSTCPSTTPSTCPSTTPSACPSTTPSTCPSTTPSSISTTLPTTSPSKSPTTAPSGIKSINPSTYPSPTSSSSSIVPSFNPSIAVPAGAPSSAPSVFASQTPSFNPTPKTPTENPSSCPSVATQTPSYNPSLSWPTGAPSNTPSDAATEIPSIKPTTMVTTLVPSITPSDAATKIPSIKPTTVVTTLVPSNTPLAVNSQTPSFNPSEVVTIEAPSFSPSLTDTTTTTFVPSSITISSTETPSFNPSSIAETTGAPTNSPSVAATETPSANPSTSIAGTTGYLSSSPTTATTETPSVDPSYVSVITGAPSTSPLAATTETPSNSPSIGTTEPPSANPSSVAVTTEVTTWAPSSSPVAAITETPTNTPSTTTETPSANPSSAIAITEDLSSSPSPATTETPSSVAVTAGAPSSFPVAATTETPSTATTEPPSYNPSSTTGPPSNSPSFIPSTVTLTDTPSVATTTTKPSLAPTIAMSTDSTSYISPSTTIATSVASTIKPTTTTFIPTDTPFSQSNPTPLSSQQPSTNSFPSAIPAATTLQFTQELALTIPDGCASLAVDQNGQRALQLTTARYLQVSPTNVTYMGCTNTAGGGTGSSHLLLLTVSSVTANLKVQTTTFASDTNHVFQDLQRKIQLAVDSRNFTRSLITVSKALHANATVFATVTGASASSSSVVTFQTPPTVAPTQTPSSGVYVSGSSSTSSSSSSSSLALVFGIIGGIVFLAICAGSVFYLVAKKRPSDEFRTTQL